MGFKVIVTGVTGMVGEGVLHECLQHSEVTQVLALTRRPTGLNHPKLKEVIQSNFYDLSPVEEQLQGYDACFFCLGVSSIGLKEPEYVHKTYDLTMHVAKTLAQFNPDTTFCYVSGASTDSTEKGKSMWARVKGKTENDLLTLFKNGYMFRPGYMQPTRGLHNTLSFYRYVSWMYPLLRKMLPSHVSTLREVGIAMIHTVTKPPSKHILEVKDIVALAQS